MDRPVDFREPDRQMWASRFGLSTADSGDVDYADFVRSAVRAGSTRNGVFAARMMWGTMHLLVAGLGRHPYGRSDVDVLERAFGPLRFVYLRRLDVVAQAVSWARAEQTGYWQVGDTVNADAQLDLDQVDDLVTTIYEHNDAWRTWFAEQAVEPLTLTYESLELDPADAVGSVLGFIGANPPSDWRPASRHERPADSINPDWVRRYRASRT